MLMAYFNQLQLIVLFFGLWRALWLPGFGLHFFLAARFAGPRLHLFLVFVDAFLDPLRDKLGLFLGLPGFWLARAIFIASCWVSGEILSYLAIKSSPRAWLAGEYAIKARPGGVSLVREGIK